MKAKRKYGLVTLAGNHQREAYYIKRNQYPNELAYKKKNIVVYVNLKDEDALLVAAQHNTDNDVRHSMTNMDMCRFIHEQFISDGADRTKGKLKVFKDKIARIFGWSDSKVKAMDNWFQVGFKTGALWNTIMELFAKFKQTPEQFMHKFGIQQEKSKQTSKKRKTAEKAVGMKKPKKLPEWRDLNVTIFYKLQGLPDNEQLRLLTKVTDGTLTIPQMIAEARTVKTILNIRKAMLQECNIESWDKMKEMYPAFTKEASLNCWMNEFSTYSKKRQEVSSRFKQWCQKILRGKSMEVNQGSASASIGKLQFSYDSAMISLTNCNL
jgi:hypothetical protein